MGRTFLEAFFFELNLTPDQRHMLDAVLRLFNPTPESGPINVTNQIEHVIDTGDAKPVMKRQYTVSPYVAEQVQAELDKMRSRDIIMTIEESPWRSPILAVKKKDGTCRVCLDAREFQHD
ncbi:PREDICTED: uncharacterized protein LOC108354313 [Rhagoletis zephyria]|uniref:uncharacterized protein LOC108354313 n=1 Tax=Rhagoletis zephyria TaxID=28612 RepID=UPI0008117466|nr:PREDICTED: uncharacterized protein LOC108354313 [Rhagoletis zephyria]